MILASRYVAVTPSTRPPASPVTRHRATAAPWHAGSPHRAATGVHFGCLAFSFELPHGREEDKLPLLPATPSFTAFVQKGLCSGAAKL